MARLRLTVGKITVATEKETGKFVVPVSLLNMSENVPADRGAGRLEYLQKR